MKGIESLKSGPGKQVVCLLSGKLHTRQEGRIKKCFLPDSGTYY